VITDLSQMSKEVDGIYDSWATLSVGQPM